MASPNAAASRGDAARAAFERKFHHYRHEIRELLAHGILCRPLVWTADGRPHIAVARTLQCAADGFSADGNMEFKLLFFVGGPRRAQSCQTPRRGQSGSSPVSLIEPCITWTTSLLFLTVELATTTTQTPRLTQPYQMMTMTSPPSLVNRPHLCSLHAFSCSLLPSRQFASAHAMMFPGVFVNHINKKWINTAKDRGR